MKKRELKEKFRNLYRSEIKKDIEKFEKMRKNTVVPTLGLYLFILGIVLCCIAKTFWFGCIVAVVGGYMLWGKSETPEIIQDIDSQIKNNYMNKFLAIFGNFAWLEKPVEDFDKGLQKLNILPQNDKLNFDDVFLGSYENVGIQILETSFPFKVPNIVLILASLILFIAVFVLPIWAFLTSNAMCLIIMGVMYSFVIPAIVLLIVLDYIWGRRGVIVKCEFNKNFQFNTYLIENNLLEKLKHKEQELVGRVSLEDIEFNKKYLVFSQDQVEARYLFTTSFMQRFKNIKTAFKAKYIRAEFRDGELVIFIGTNKNLFNIAKLADGVTYQAFWELFEEVYSVISLIDQLKLNQKLGL